MQRALLTSFAAALAFSLSAGCNQPGPLAPPDKDPVPEPEFVCPLPERSAEVPPVAEFDPQRVGALPDIGRACEMRSKTLHRLNRAEYNNAVGDAFGVEVRPGDTFPTDQADHGFDNLADVQSISPLLVEKYFDAARLVADKALDDGRPPLSTQTMEAEDYLGGNASEGYARIDAGNRSLQFVVDHEGDYDIRIMAYGEQAGPDIVRMEVTLGYEAAAPTLGIFQVDNDAEDPRLFTGRVHIAPGQHVLVIRYLNDYFREEDRGEAALNRNLIVDFLEVEGPFNPVLGQPSPSREAILTCHPGQVPDEDTPEMSSLDCARQVLSPLARRVLRRPVPDSELARYVGFINLAVSDGRPFEEGLKLAFRALLLHPEFLFRVEQDPDLDDERPHLLSDHELASRLSFFLWSSGPDDRLLDLADEGKLSDPEVYDGEVHRMMLDDKARALVKNFGGQWLSTRRANDVQLDADLYREWNADLGASAGCETELYFDDLVRNEGTLNDLLLSDFTYVNKTLARHYSIASEDVDALVPPSGAHKDAAFARVSLEGTGRRGLLSQTTMLSITSHPNRTSPVKRGKWVLDQLLCMPPPPPPPNVEGLIEDGVTAVTLREQLEQHRADPVCASCHVAMDPIGLGLENFGADGRYRDNDNGLPIDASSMLFDEVPFNGPVELADALSERDELATCAVQQAMTYGVGRSMPEPWGFDACNIDSAAEVFVERGEKLEDLFALVTQTAAFKMRRADPLLDEEAALLDEELATGTP